MITLRQDESTDLLGKTCVVLGNFDGVHIGHRYLIEKAADYAKKHRLTLLIYSFGIHPRLFFNRDFRLITTESEKEEIFSRLDIDCLYLDDFPAVRELRPAEFCESVLINKLHAAAVFCGKNHRFAKDALGTPDFLKTYFENSATQIFIEDFLIKDGDAVSSSRIRALLKNGDIEEANKLLGRSFSVYFPVIHGFHLGHALGFPTINQIMPADKLVPTFGVYAAVTEIDEKLYPSVLNIGVKPTVTKNEENPPIVCETHIIDFDGDLYGRKIRVDFLKKLRCEKRFASLIELKAAVHSDIEATKLLFASKGL